MATSSPPQLYCPFPSAINPHADAANERAIAWAQRWRLSSEPGAYQKLAKLNLGALAGLTHTTASARSLQLIADWCAWLFIHDDLCDEAALAHQPVALAHWHEDLFAVMHHPAGQQIAEHGMVAGFADLWRRSIEQAPPGWADRFQASIRAFFTANVWEAHNRAAHLRPDLETYLRQRPLTSGMDMFIDLIEVAHPLTLTPEIRNHPLVQELRALTARGACWVNDILSYEKELRQGDHHNLVLVLAHTYQTSYAEALTRAAAIHDNDIRMFIRCERLLLSRPDLASATLRGYTAVLRSYLRGNLDWTSQSIRYRRDTAQLLQKSVGR